MFRGSNSDYSHPENGSRWNKQSFREQGSMVQNRTKAAGRKTLNQKKGQHKLGRYVIFQTIIPSRQMYLTVEKCYAGFSVSARVRTIYDHIKYIRYKITLNFLEGIHKWNQEGFSALSPYPWDRDAPGHMPKCPYGQLALKLAKQYILEMRNTLHAQNNNSAQTRGNINRAVPERRDSRAIRKPKIRPSTWKMCGVQVVFQQCMERVPEHPSAWGGG